MAQETELRRLLAQAVEGGLELLCWCHPLPCHAEVVRGAVLWLVGEDRKQGANTRHEQAPLLTFANCSQPEYFLQ